MTTFTEISDRYQIDSIVQKSASEILMDLLEIKKGDTILDLGCGTGHITHTLQQRSRGTVVGIDPSPGMINKAREKFTAPGSTFQCGLAENLTYNAEFDIIFCNSAFQWFSQPAQSLAACYLALKPGGKMAIQAPATTNYCPNFLQAIGEVQQHPSTQVCFAGFTAPWFFLESAETYAQEFEKAGFSVLQSFIDEVRTSHSPQETFTIFDSGASAGYFNSEYYARPLSQEYIEAFRTIVRRSFEQQAGANGQVELIFYRIYLLAQKIQEG